MVPYSDPPTEASIGALEDALKTHHGIQVPHLTPAFLASVLSAVAADLGSTPERTYRDVLAGDPVAMLSVAGIVSVKETYLFRDPADFEALRGYVLPELRRARGSEDPLLWSAGCATGEEPWSLFLTAQAAGVPCRILGTDISQPALDRALTSPSFRPDRIPRTELVPALESRLDAWLETDGRVARPRPRLLEEFQARASFMWHDLLYDAVPWQADAVFLRNVLIYYSAEHRDGMLWKVAAKLRRPGFLFVADVELPAILATARAAGFAIEEHAGASFLALR